jgi:hypothetical protein
MQEKNSENVRYLFQRTHPQSHFGRILCVNKAKFLPMLAIVAAVFVAGLRHGFMLFIVCVTTCFVLGIIACVLIDAIRGSEEEVPGFDVVVPDAQSDMSWSPKMSPFAGLGFRA